MTSHLILIHKTKVL